MKILKQLLGWKRGMARKGAISALALKMGVRFSTVKNWALGSPMKLATQDYIERLHASGEPLALAKLGRPHGSKKKVCEKVKDCLTAQQAQA